MKIIYAGLAFALLGGVAGLAGPVEAQSSAAASASSRYADDPLPADGRFVPGDRVPNDYQQDSYVVTTWQADGLESPPADYRWLRNDRGGQYLMASRSSGRIADTIDQASLKKLRNPAASNDDGRPQGTNPAGRLWARGDHLGPDDFDAEAIVVNWKGTGLPRPAPGYRWVSINNHYLLADRHTGLIKDVR